MNLYFSSVKIFRKKSYFLSIVLNHYDTSTTAEDSSPLYMMHALDQMNHQGNVSEVFHAFLLCNRFLQWKMDHKSEK